MSDVLKYAYALVGDSASSSMIAAAMLRVARFIVFFSCGAGDDG
jgi:hypothetical protein